MSKIHKTAQVAASIYTESRLPSFWVFSTFQGTGTAKMPIRGYIDEDLAKEHAESINGYYVNLSIKSVK